ncbi:ExeM/NucH family extracellular endonuclease [Marinihelvus fidelis]|uniref:ExeM/NucH family extracellular endonuclease n=1 Tax=Marinihelvus fidelis TaxID=2613842 RepID=UPI00177A8AE7|nr:ExeM/NucH family extracellular endonuclease [Marinihelvus fidelis]
MGRTPRILTSLAVTALVAGCADHAGDILQGGPLCEGPSTPLGQVQGSDFQSPLSGTQVTVQGVVTLARHDGAYIESTSPDTDPQTAEGLFLAAPVAARLEPGMRVAVNGTVTELGEQKDTQTALAGFDSLSVCAEHEPLPLTPMRLPMPAAERERLENMRVTIDTATVATDVYRLDRGEIRVAAGGMLPSPTEVAWPGTDARRQRARNRDATLFAQLAEGDRSVFPGGTEVVSDLGVLGHDGKGPRLYLEDRANLAKPLSPTLTPPASDALRVLSLNLQNYFNGDGRGGGFPTPRGAETARAFEHQRERLRATVSELQPDIIAVMEIENDGFGQHSAARDFIADLEKATGADWDVASPNGGPVGTDEITVGLFHRTDRVTATVQTLALNAPPFDLLNRQPLARAYRPAGGGPAFIIVVNHFKSKGSCPDQGRDRDLGDGQGCWNAARTAAATSLAGWVLQLAQQQADGRALIVGDLNAYRLEDPVRELVKAGFEDLTGGGELGHEYSYVFYGEAGTLDYALATPELRRSVIQARILHINASWPPGMDLPQPWLRSSDHDPVIVDLRFRQSSTAY